MRHFTSGSKKPLLLPNLFVQTLAFFLGSMVMTFAQNPLSSAGAFNIFTQSNATLITNESEGAVAIGGNLTVGGNYQVAFSTSGSFVQQAFPNVKIGLVVGGGVLLQSGNLKVLNNGFIKIGNCAGGNGLSSLRVWFRDQNNATSPIRITKSNEGYASPSSFIELNGNANTFYANLADTASNPICQANVLDFATAFTTLQANSSTLTSCTGNVRTTNANGEAVTNFSGQNLYLRDPVGGLPANTTRVLNIAGSDLNAVNNITLSFTPTASQPLVINVSTGTTFNWNVTNQNVSGSMKYILWNFPNATTLNIQGNATIEGSVLAPNAAVTKTTNQSNIEGQLIAQSFVMSGGEMHNYPFEGNVTCGTPVCNAPTPTAANVERCGPGTVTFTASGCTTGFTPKWYTTNALSTEAGSGTSFTTPSLTNTTNYYLACVKDSDASCKSTGVQVTATVNPAVNVTIDGPTAVCIGDLPVVYTASPANGTFTLPNGLTANDVTTSGNTLTLKATTTLSSLSFSYVVTGTNGCGGTATKDITISRGGTPVNLSPASICENQTLNYTDANGTNGTWGGFGVTDTGSGATFNAAQALTQAGKSAPASVYIVYTQTDGACSRQDSALITINPLPVVTMTGPETLCANELSAVYTATPAGGSFSLPNGLPSGFATTNGNVLTLNPGFNITSLTFSYSYTDPTTNCSATASKSVTITPAPAPTVNSPAICAGETTTLTVANCTGSVLWSTQATSASIQVSPATTTTYTVTCTNNGCDSTVTATVTVNPKPQISLSGEPVCSADLLTYAVSFTATNGATFSTDKGTLSGNTVLGIPAGQTVQIIASLNGCTDTLLVTKDCNCPTVTPPTLAASPATICAGASSTLSATGCSGTVTFYSDQALSSPLASLTVAPATTTTYYATCTEAASSCVSQPAEITITVTAKPVIGAVNLNAATCTGLSVNADASISISGITNGDRYTAATTLAGLAGYTSATSLAGSSALLTNLPNPATPTGQQYIVRIFNGSDECFRDTVLTLPYRDCNVLCTQPDAGNDVFICSPTSSVDLPDASGTQQWIAGPANAGGAIDPTTGAVSGLSADGLYTYFLVDGAIGSTCADTVLIVRGSISLPDQTTCTDTLTLPVFGNGTWAAANGNTATVDGSGKVSGLTQAGSYLFELSTGDCVATLTLIKQDCFAPCPIFTLAGDARDTLCSDTYGEAMTIKTSSTSRVKFVRFTTPQTALTVYTGGTLLATVEPVDSLASWPAGIPGSQFPANTTGSPVTYYVYALSDDTSSVAPGCRPFIMKEYVVFPLPAFTQATSPVCTDSTTYPVNITISSPGTYRLVVTNGFISVGNGPVPSDTIQILNSLPGNGAVTSLSVAVSDSAAAVIVYNEATGCASILPLINPNLINCTQTVDLALDKSISKKIAMVGEELSYTLRVWNEGQASATGVEVTDPLNAGVQFITSATAQGTYNPATGIWTIGALAVGDTATLVISVRILSEGVWFNTAEISKTNEKDVDSTPDNGVESEDDIDRECFTVPIILCQGQGGSVELAVPAQYTNVVWFRKIQGGQPVQVATGNTYTAQESDPGSYEYTFTSSAGSCPAEGCCPILIAVQECCPAEICVPITIKKVRNTSR